MSHLTSFENIEDFYWAIDLHRGQVVVVSVGENPVKDMLLLRHRLCFKTKKEALDRWEQMVVNAFRF